MAVGHSAAGVCILPGSRRLAHLQSLRTRFRSAQRLFPLFTRISAPSGVRDRLTPDRHTLKPTEDNMDTTITIAGYEVPVDPMDLLNCDSCQ